MTRLGKTGGLRAVLSISSRLGASVVLAISVHAMATDFKMTSLDWPPYTDEKLPAQGAASAVVAEAIKASGNHVKIEFYPWSRSVYLVKTGKSHIAYFPEYYSKSNEAEFLYSDPIGVGPLVFIERKANPIQWTTYDSLKGKKIGVVKDYVNTDELDAKIASKVLFADVAPDDVKNILKLAAGRVDIAVIDTNVFNFLVQNNVSVKVTTQVLYINDLRSIFL
jgi:polar amino acid transport system substrate-binding protein